MPVYWLDDTLRFPPPEGASPEGVVAAGGGFEPERLLLAYSQGIFPWPIEGLPLLWFSPDPRFALDPRRAHISRSLAKRLRRCPFEVAFDRDFRAVIRRCATRERPTQSGTWITDELETGYRTLFDLGYAHSIESYREGRLVGGLYGVSLGRVFFGESMFALEPDASKVAFAVLLAHLVEWGFTLVDCQVRTDHLARFGAEDWDRDRFLRVLRQGVALPTHKGPWSVSIDPTDAPRVLAEGPLVA